MTRTFCSGTVSILTGLFITCLILKSATLRWAVVGEACSSATLLYSLLIHTGAWDHRNKIKSKGILHFFTWNGCFSILAILFWRLFNCIAESYIKVFQNWEVDWEVNTVKLKSLTQDSNPGWEVPMAMLWLRCKRHRKRYSGLSLLSSCICSEQRLQAIQESGVWTAQSLHSVWINSLSTRSTKFTQTDGTYEIIKDIVSIVRS